MQKLSKNLWLLLLPSLGVLVWMWVRDPRPSNASPNAPAASTVDTWLLTGSILCALIVSVAGVFIAARLRNVGPPLRRPGRHDVLRLVQSLRVSSRHWIHAIEFEAKIILIGVCDGNIVLLRGESESSDEDHVQFSDEGVDLRDTPAAEGEFEDRPRKLAEVTAARDIGRTALDAANLADFKTLLKQARQSASV